MSYQFCARCDAGFAITLPQTLPRFPLQCYACFTEYGTNFPDSILIHGIFQKLEVLPAYSQLAHHILTRRGSFFMDSDLPPHTFGLAYTGNNNFDADGNIKNLLRLDIYGNGDMSPVLDTIRAELEMVGFAATIDRQSVYVRRI